MGIGDPDEAAYHGSDGEGKGGGDGIDETSAVSEGGNGDEGEGEGEGDGDAEDPLEGYWHETTGWKGTPVGDDEMR